MEEGLKKILYYIYAFISYGIPFLLAAAGVLGVKWVNDNPNNTNNISIVFTGIYMIVFAFVLALFETVQYIPSEWLDLQVKKNFGFLYGPIGKGLYTLLVGIFAFGLEKPKQLGIGAGIVVGGWGVFTICLAFVLTDFFPKREKYIP